MSDINKWVLRFIRFMVGLFMGFFVTVWIVGDPAYESLNMPWFPRVDVPGVPEVYSSWKIVTLWLGSMIIFLIVITLIARLIARFIATSESVVGTAVVLNVVADFLVGVPLAATIWCMVVFILDECTNLAETIPTAIAILSVAYAFVYVFACAIIDVFYFSWVQKPLKKKVDTF